MDKPAFLATYSDWKYLKTRGVIQVVFEIPLHDEESARAVLGGMPNPAEEGWYGITRVDPNAGQT